MSVPNSTKYYTDDVLAILIACGVSKAVEKISYVNKPWTYWGSTTKHYVKFRHRGWGRGLTIMMVRVSAAQGSPLLQLAGAAEGEFLAPENVLKDLVRCAIEAAGFHGDAQLTRALSNLKKAGHKLRYHEVKKRDKKAIAANYLSRISKKEQVIKSHRRQIQILEREVAYRQKKIEDRLAFIKAAEKEITRLGARVKKAKENGFLGD